MMGMSKRENQVYEDGHEDDTEEPMRNRKTRVISISLPEDLANKVEDYAREHDLKRSRVIVEALETGLGEEDRIVKQLNRNFSRINSKLDEMNSRLPEKVKEPLETNPSQEAVLTNEQREDIESLLEYCTPSSDSFELEGEDGFLTEVQKRELQGDIWSDEILENFATKLSIAYENYFVTPDAQTLIDRCSKAMGLSEDQQTKLTEYFAELQGLEVEYTEVQKQKSRKLPQTEEKAEETAGESGNVH